MGSTIRKYPAGETESSEYGSWSNMIQRCTNKNHPSYSYYGGKGVTVCKRWINSYEKFLADMGRKPSREYTIERTNGKRGYSPSNCIWETRFVQSNNRENNVSMTIDGVTMNISGWAMKTGVAPQTIGRRLKKGLSPTMAISKERLPYGFKLKG